MQAWHSISVEWQKRGLAHLHALLRYLYRMRCREDLDNYVCAELPPHPSVFADGSPEQEQAARLFDLVVNLMVHTPCGAHRAGDTPRPCEGVQCKKCKFPHPCREQSRFETRPSGDYIAIPGRRSPAMGGGAAHVEGKGWITSQWIVPCDPFDLLRWSCHVNRETTAGQTGVLSCTAKGQVLFMFFFFA